MKVNIFAGFIIVSIASIYTSVTIAEQSNGFHHYHGNQVGAANYVEGIKLHQKFIVGPQKQHRVHTKSDDKDETVVVSNDGDLYEPKKPDVSEQDYGKLATTIQDQAIKIGTTMVTALSSNADLSPVQQSKVLLLGATLVGVICALLAGVVVFISCRRTATGLNPSEVGGEVEVMNVSDTNMENGLNLALEAEPEQVVEGGVEGRFVNGTNVIHHSDHIV